MKKIFTLVAVILSFTTNVFSQCGWTGPSNLQTSNPVNPAIAEPAWSNCNWSSAWCAGSGTYTYIGETAGRAYEVENTTNACGTAMSNPYLTAWEAPGSTSCGWGTIANPGGGYNSAGTNKIQFISSVSNNVIITVSSSTATNDNDCGLCKRHDFSGTSATLRYRRIGRSTSAGSITYEGTSNQTICEGQTIACTSTGAGTVDYGNVYYKWYIGNLLSGAHGSGSYGNWQVITEGTSAASAGNVNPFSYTWGSGSTTSFLIIRRVYSDCSYECFEGCNADKSFYLNAIRTTAGTINIGASAYCINSTAITANTGTNATTTSGTLTFDWYIQDVTNANYSALIATNTSQTYSSFTGAQCLAISGAASNHTFRILRRAYSNSCGACIGTCWDAHSGNFTLDALSSYGTLSTTGPVVTCDNVGNITAPSVSGTTGSLSWDWGRANGLIGGSPWVAGATSGSCCFPVNPNFGTADGADRVRINATNGTCPTATSPWILIENRNSPTPSGLTASSTAYCQTSVPGSITLTANFVSGSNSFANVLSQYSQVQFYSGSCGGTLLGTVSPTFTAPGTPPSSAQFTLTGGNIPTTPGTYSFFARSTSSCETSTCAQVDIVVSATSNAGTYAYSTLYSCDGQTRNASGTVVTNSVTGALGTIQWQFYTSGSGWTNWCTGAPACGTTCFPYNPSPGEASRMRVVVTNGTCPAATGADVNVVPSTPSITNVTASANPICGQGTTTLTANGVAGLGTTTVTWWSGAVGTGVNLGTGATKAVGASSGATYYARVTDVCGAVNNCGVNGASPAAVASISNINTETDAPSTTAPTISVYNSPLNGCKGALDYSIANVTDGSCSGQSGSDFVIPSGGLVTWLRADAGITLDGNNGVGTWHDLSGNNNDLRQTNPTNRPTVVSNVINGKPVVRFNTSQFLISALDVSNPYTIVTVSKLNGGTNQRLISNASPGYSNNWLLGYWGTYKNQIYAGGWVNNPATAADAIPHLYTATGDGVTTSFYDYGNLIAANGSGVLKMGKLQLNGTNGESGTVAESSDGDIAEVIVYNRVLSAAERQVVEGYIGIKYGLTVPYASLLAYQTQATGATVTYQGADAAGNTSTASITPVAQYPGPTVTPSATTICNGSNVTLTLSGMAPAGNKLAAATNSDWLCVGGATCGVPGTSNLVVGSSWTIESWVKFPLPNTGGAGNWNTLIRGTNHHHIIVNNDGTNKFLGTYLGGFQSSGFNTNLLAAGWHHITAVGSGGSTSFYIDGVYVGKSASQPTDNIVCIGNYQGGGQQFGDVDEVRMWNTTLSQNTINQWMTRGITNSHANWNSLVGYYKMDNNGTNSAGGTSACGSCSGILQGAATYNTATAFYTYTPTNNIGGSITAGGTTETYTVTGATTSGTVTFVASANSCNSTSTSSGTITVDQFTTSAAGADQDVCATTATLAGNTPATGVGTWTLIGGAGSITSPNSPTSGLTALGAGANTFRWTLPNGTCTDSQDDVVITRSDFTTAAAGPDQTICATTATLAGNTPATGLGTWTLISGAGSITSPNLPTSGLTALGAGANTFRWTLPNGSCADSQDDVIITQDQPITILTASASPNPICENDVLNLTASNTGGTNITWSWSGPSGFSSATQNTTRGSLNESLHEGVYTVKAINACHPGPGGLTANTASVNIHEDFGFVSSVTVNPNPVCEGSSITLTANFANGTPTDATYSWTGPNSFSSSTASPTRSNMQVADGGSYDVTVSNACYPGGQSNGTIASLQPVINATIAVDECMGTSPTDKYYLLVTGSGGTGTLSYSGTPVISVGNQKVYYEDAGTTLNVTITDQASPTNCSKTVSVTAPNGHPQDIPLTSTTGSVSVNCYDVDLDRWVTFRDNSNNAILSINDNINGGGVNNNLGLVNVTVYKESTEPSVTNTSGPNCQLAFNDFKAMTRHFVVTTENAPTEPVGVRLYFTAAEANSLKASSLGNNGPDNCTENDDFNDNSGLTDLYVTKYSAPSGQLATEDDNYNNNLPGGVYKVFGVDNGLPGSPDGPLTKAPNQFSSVFSGGPGYHYVQLSVTEFSEFWLHGSLHGAPLPVEMIYFQAEAVNNSYIQLTWATAIEIDNDGFIVERSVDAQTWSNIGWVEGHDNATTQHDYSFNDYNVEPNVRYYYRLKQMDNDGDYEYTTIVSEMITTQSTFAVKDFVPNPTMNNTSLIVSSSEEQDIEVKFYDVIGQVVSSSKHSLHKGGNQITFSLEHLSAGTYTAIVTSRNEVYSKKLVVTR